MNVARPPFLGDFYFAVSRNVNTIWTGSPVGNLNCLEIEVLGSKLVEDIRK